MKRKAIITAVVAIVLAAGVGWYFASPSYALSQLRDASIEGDVDELEQRIDFPAVRESLKAQLRAHMIAEMAKQGENDGLGALGGMFAMGMIGPVIDSIVTPEGMKVMMERGKFAQAKGDVPKVEDQPETSWHVERHGLSRFAAVADVPVGQKAPSLVFDRDGLGWRLVKIDIPEGGLGEEAQSPLD